MAAFPLDAVLQKLSEIVPLRLAESWDNVGLLLGDRRRSIDCVMTCLTITPEVVDEAIQRRVGLIVAHHPMPFKPLTRITSDSTTGKMLLDLIASGIAVYSAHTAFDSAAGGINAMWAELLGLRNVKPLDSIPASPDESIGAGRYGVLAEPTTDDALAKRVAELVNAPRCRVVKSFGMHTSMITKIAIACGSGGGLLAAAKRRGCDAMVTGEATFHTCLEAQASGISLLLVGHFHSEQFAMVKLAETLGKELADLDVFASQSDVDPLKDGFSERPKH